jgi:WXG100 family type VII secretion target
MSSSFGTSTDAMTAAANQVDAVSQEISHALCTLKNQIDPLAHSWQGGAASAFNALMTQWHEDAGKLTSALSDISQALNASGKNYAETESSNHSAIASILGGMS